MTWKLDDKGWIQGEDSALVGNVHAHTFRPQDLRLLLAAPEMLALLRRAYESLVWEHPDEHVKLLAPMRLLIAKLDGEKPVHCSLCQRGQPCGEKP